MDEMYGPRPAYLDLITASTAEQSQTNGKPDKKTEIQRDEEHESPTTVGGNAASGNTASGDTAGGNTAGANTAGGNTASGNGSPPTNSPSGKRAGVDLLLLQVLLLIT